jgi:hypothetical protein
MNSRNPADIWAFLWYLYSMGRHLRNSRGMTIGTVLLLVTVGSLAIFTMVAMAFFHMRFSNVIVNQRSARNIAESALATALTKVWESNTYGTERGVLQFVHLNSTTDEAAEGFVSFNKAKASEFGVPFSTNNFESEAAVEGGNGRTVPDSAVHIVALGECRGARYKVEMLYYVPPYPNAMASSGPVVATGGLLVAGLPSVERATEIKGAGGLDKNKLEPGHIMSNSSSGQAIFVGPGSEIRGDLVAVGGIKVGSPVEILGEVRPNASPQTVPSLNVDGVFEKLDEVATRDKILDPTVPDGTAIDYFTEATAPLTVRGDLVLDGGVLYCRDDLNVQGEVTGNGAIFSLGDVKIDGGADLSASDQIAVVAKGSLELQGASKESQYFNGLVYSEEEILASDITIIGAAVVNGDKDSLLQLDNVNLIKTPLAVKLVIGTPDPSSISFNDSPPGGDDAFLGLFGNERDYSLDLSNMKKELLGNFAISGSRVPDVKGESRFSLNFEVVLSRSTKPLASLEDLTAEEKARLPLDEYPYYFRNGKLQIMFPGARQVSRAEAIEAGTQYQDLLADMLPKDIAYDVILRKKNRFFGIKTSDKTSVAETRHFNPASALKKVDIGGYLDKLEEPEKDEKTVIDLSLNRVIDPAESSKILFWQSF